MALCWCLRSSAIFAVCKEHKSMKQGSDTNTQILKTKNKLKSTRISFMNVGFQTMFLFLKNNIVFWKQKHTHKKKKTYIYKVLSLPFIGLFKLKSLGAGPSLIVDSKFPFFSMRRLFLGVILVKINCVSKKGLWI